MQLGWRKNYTRYRSFFLDIYRVYKVRKDLKMYLEIILSLGTISFFAAFALRPTALTITQLLEEIKTKEEVVAKTDQKIRDIKVAQEVYQREFARVGLINQAIPDGPTPEDFARQIEGLSLRNGVILNSVIMGDIQLAGDVQKPPSGDFTPLPEGALEVSFSLNAVGAYPNLQNFLKDLENMRRPVKVDYAIMSVAQSAESKTLTISVSGRIPYLERE